MFCRYFFYRNKRRCRGQSQQLKGDTIYTSFLVPAVLQFPAPIIAANFKDKAANATYTKVVISSSIVLGAKRNNAAPAILLLNEGGRKHQITIVCSTGLSKKDLTYNWQTPADLEKFIALNDRKKKIS